MEETIAPPPLTRRRYTKPAPPPPISPQQFSDALALLDTAQTMLAMVERSPALEISSRTRIGGFRGKIQLERDFVESARALAVMNADRGISENETWRS